MPRTHETPPQSAAAPSPRTRAARLQALEAAARDGVDLVVVGGGITGAGTARDAAMRGLRVLLVDRGDWAQGTSSRSSKLIHGGLRYLENLQFGLVMEGTRERHRQARLNPHLVQPLAFIMPVYKGGRHSLLKLSLGLWLYDLLALFRTYRIHRRLGRERTLGLAAPLRAEGLKGAIHYYDCRGDDARLTLANALDAERHGAITANYTRFDGPVMDAATNRVRGARVTDVLSGETFEIGCRHIAVAAGPWTDTLAQALGHPARLRPTKGVHLVFDRTRLPIDVAVTMNSIDDGRVVFAIPLGNATYVGTTDTDYQGQADDVAATADDVSYLLRTTNHFFPDAKLVEADIQSTWAALRPLVRSDADSAYKTSREHEIWHDPRGISTIAGGKLTTYRAMAEEFLDAILSEMKRTGPLPRLAKCATHRVPLDPDADAAAKADDPQVRAAAATQGSAARGVGERIAAVPDDAALLTPELPWTYAQVAVAADHEHAQTIEDVLVRRFQVFFRATDRGAGCARRVATILAERLGHDAAWVDGQVAAYDAYIAMHMRGARESGVAGLAPFPKVR
jgi:glycerol-3-phosphate dehydrogenase